MNLRNEVSKKDYSSKTAIQEQETIRLLCLLVTHFGITCTSSETLLAENIPILSLLQTLRNTENAEQLYKNTCRRSEHIRGWSLGRHCG
ncbi:hypothetical protein GDO78_015085 [Eleutherodactylus coqui]|uniref:Uncharacterized protein n=1 Tax=Eleutherodactylus coqui TaxID=57060 RepID=A0A8J6EDY0_ELECQ|nr:hypothetical protein GDO78_015085 [Eleutherodactylus coqui]